MRGIAEQALEWVQGLRGAGLPRPRAGGEPTVRGEIKERAMETLRGMGEEGRERDRSGESGAAGAESEVAGRRGGAATAPRGRSSR